MEFVVNLMILSKTGTVHENKTRQDIYINFECGQ